MARIKVFAEEVREILNAEIQMHPYLINAKNANEINKWMDRIELNIKNGLSKRVVLYSQNAEEKRDDEDNPQAQPEHSVSPAKARGEENAQNSPLLAQGMWTPPQNLPKSTAAELSKAPKAFFSF